MPDLNDIPNFENYDDLIAFMEKQSGETLEAQESDIVNGVPVEYIWQTRDFYTREDDRFVNTKRDAEEVAGTHAANVIVKAHNHIYGAACTKKCVVISVPETS